MNPVKKELKKIANKKIAEHSQRFFKTGKGEYGAGDVFIGVRVPDQRKIAKKFTEIPMKDVTELVKSKIHEERLTGLIILVNKYKMAEKANDEKQQDKIYSYYVRYFKYVNNWDLVDVTCPHVIGAYLLNRDRKVLYKWAVSDHLWTKRIAIVSNWWFIRKGDLKDVFSISELLLNDDHDLIHKAVGWMLREAWKKDVKKTESFLKKHYKKMPRTMLRYAIEKMTEAKRQRFLKGLA